jgi:16S rRNA processing protein RimM
MPADSSAAPSVLSPAQSPPDLPAELLVVGRLVAAQGLGGEVRVLPLSDFPERFTTAGWRWLRPPGGLPRPVALLRGRPLPGKDLYVLRLAGVEDRAAAEALVAQELLVDAAQRPSLEPGEFHWLDLKGLEARLLPGGEVIGRVTDLIHAGNDLLEVEVPDPPGRRLLIPFVPAIVPEVRLEEGWLGVTPPPGLLEL